MRVHQQNAYVLLNRPYSETSFIVETFTENYGRMALIAKGARRLKSPFKGLLMPFQPLLLSWTGKGEVPTLTSAEIQTQEFDLFEYELTGDPLVCGFYCNELLVNLLHRHDPHPGLYKTYHQTLLNLYNTSVRDEAALAIELRDFERSIIKEAGYGVNFTHEADQNKPIDRHAYYNFYREKGFVRAQSTSRNAYRGSAILALDETQQLKRQELKTNSEGRPVDTNIIRSDQQSAKILMREIVQQTLGHKQIKSRELFFPKSR